MKKEDAIFCLFINNIDQNKLLGTYQNYIETIIKSYGTFTIICFSRYSKKNLSKRFKVNILKKKFKNKIKFFYPKNKYEFIKFTKNKRILALDAVGKDFKDYKIRYLINRKNIFLILLSNKGSLSNEYIGKKQSTKNIFWSYSKFLSKYFYRILIIFNIFPKTFLYFESRAKIVDRFLNSNLRKFINKKANLKFLKNFLNIYRINSNAYDNFLKSKKLKKNNKIIFLDLNYKHSDITQRERLNLDHLEIEYFNLLSSKLTNIERLYNKKVEICLHPSSDLIFYKKKLKKFKVSQGQSIEKVLGCYMVIFHDTSAVMEAIVAKKKMLILETNFFGNYISNRMIMFKKLLKVPTVDLHSNKALTKDIFKDYNKSEKYRNIYIKNNLVKNYDENSPTFFIKKIDNLIARIN